MAVLALAALAATADAVPKPGAHSLGPQPFDMPCNPSATRACRPVPCFPNHASCPFAFGTNGTGCCALDDPEAVCCETPLPTGLKRSYCCPKGASCGPLGCTPQPTPRSLCGPEQGANCNVSYMCSSGPADWTSAATATATAGSAVLVIGDSVSIGWTPILAALINVGSPGNHTVAHSPGAMVDGGARSTSNFVNCADYLLSTATLQPLPLKDHDVVLVNFGLHDYNLGLAGVAEYTSEYRTALTKVKAAASGATVHMVLTSPAHNTGSAAEDDVTVVALNKAAAALAAEFEVNTVDLHAPLIKECGPVPWADAGPDACVLCAPNCKALSVHYTDIGYQFIAEIIAEGIGFHPGCRIPPCH